MLIIFLVFCVVFFLFCLSSSCVMCAQCCQCLWVVHSLFPLRVSLTFIQPRTTSSSPKNCCPK